MKEWKVGYKVKLIKIPCNGISLNQICTISKIEKPDEFGNQRFEVKEQIEKSTNYLGMTKSCWELVKTNEITNEYEWLDRIQENFKEGV